MTLAELLKSKGIEDETIKAIQDEMKANKIFTASEENLDVRYGKLKTDHDGKIAELTEAQNFIAELIIFDKSGIFMEDYRWASSP